MYLGVGQPQPSHTAAVGFGVDGAEFLLNGAEIGHQSVQIHVLPLIQRLCRQTRQDVTQISETVRELEFLRVFMCVRPLML